MLETNEIESRQGRTSALAGSIALAQLAPPVAFREGREFHCGYGDWSDWDNSGGHSDWDDQSDGPM